MTKLYPKISIVTPSYNQGDYIEMTIQSVINQNYPNLEYIIIDGGSSDQTLDIIRKYEHKISFWTTEVDKGLYDAINKGFQMASGEILGWLNSDDVYLPNSLFSVAEIFDSFKEVRWLQGANSHMDDYGRIVSVYPSSYWTKFDLLSGVNKNIQQESCFFRLELWKEIGGKIDIKYKLAGDYSLWCNFSKSSDLHITSAPIGCFRYRTSNQKSYTHRKEYDIEKRKILEAEKKYQVNNLYLLLYTIFERISFFKFLRIINLEQKFKQTFFKGPKTINFDRTSQSFRLF